MPPKALLDFSITSPCGEAACCPPLPPKPGFAYEASGAGSANSPKHQKDGLLSCTHNQDTVPLRFGRARLTTRLSDYLLLCSPSSYSPPLIERPRPCPHSPKGRLASKAPGSISLACWSQPDPLLLPLCLHPSPHEAAVIP